MVDDLLEMAVYHFSKQVWPNLAVENGGLLMTLPDNYDK